MKRVGVLDNGEDLREFTLGFTQGKASFDFIDVGHGKERADSKIRGRLPTHAMMLLDRVTLVDEPFIQRPQDGIFETTTANKSSWASRTTQAMPPSSTKSYATNRPRAASPSLKARPSCASSLPQAPAS